MAMRTEATTTGMVFQGLKEACKGLLFSFLDQRSYMVQPLSRPEMRSYRLFRQRAREITRRHWAQDATTVASLQEKYRKPMIGTGRPLDFVEMLSQCIDPLELRFGCTSQLTHTLQVLEAMERDGIDDPYLLLAGLMHDIGKVLLLAGEAPEYIESNGLKTPIGDPEPGIGLNNCIFRWDHCDFAYVRFREYVPDHIAWLLRHHGMDPVKCARFMDERDRAYMKYYRLFAKYDDETKSMFQIPETRLERYRTLVASVLPSELTI